MVIIKIGKNRKFYNNKVLDYSHLHKQIVITSSSFHRGAEVILVNLLGANLESLIPGSWSQCCCKCISLVQLRTQHSFLHLIIYLDQTNILVPNMCHTLYRPLNSSPNTVRQS